MGLAIKNEIRYLQIRFIFINLFLNLFTDIKLSLSFDNTQKNKKETLIFLI